MKQFLIVVIYIFTLGSSLKNSKPIRVGAIYPKEGKISIDGQYISSVTLSSLRKNIAMVSQDIILFDDTVQANISYANMNASKEQIKKACDYAAASDFIEELPNSYETIIGENGVRLSGGQKQRISIARAFLKNSPIILLDEATSSLDAEIGRAHV